MAVLLKNRVEYGRRWGWGRRSLGKERNGQPCSTWVCLSHGVEVVLGSGQVHREEVVYFPGARFVFDV